MRKSYSCRDSTCVKLPRMRNQGVYYTTYTINNYSRHVSMKKARGTLSELIVWPFNPFTTPIYIGDYHDMP